MVIVIATTIAGVATAGAAVPAGVAGSAVVTTVATTAANGALVSASSGAAVASTAAIASGPLGWIILGAQEHTLTKHYSFDCWKSVLHDESKQPSSGKLFRDIIQDSRIKQVILTDNEKNADQPKIILENLWNERFRIEYVQLPNNCIGAHAVKLEY